MPKNKKEDIAGIEIDFLKEIHETNMKMSNKADNYLQIHMGFLGALILFSVGQLISQYGLLDMYATSGWIIIIITLFICLLISLYYMIPKATNTTHRINLFFYGDFLKSLKSWKDYAREVKSTIKSKEDMLDSFSYQIWNLANKEIRPKFFRIKLVSIILVTGIMVGVLVMFIPYLF